jgi:hypothetical protein
MCFLSTLHCTVCLVCRMSVFFFRLHNLRREEQSKKRKKANSGSSTSTGGGMQQRRSISLGRHRYHSALTGNPGRLFERTPLTPSDSLDEIALQIPRCHPPCLSLSYSPECFVVTLLKICFHLFYRRPHVNGMAELHLSVSLC